MSEHELDRFHRQTGITEADYEVLQAMALFRGLERTAIEDLLEGSWVQSFAKNTVLFLQGEPVSRFFIILDGWVKTFTETRNGEECVVAAFAHGETFGEAAVLNGGISMVNAIIVQESRLLIVPATSFIERLRRDGDCALNMMTTLSHNLERLVQQVELLSVKSSMERLAGYLVRHTPAMSGPVIIHLPLDKGSIARHLGMQPETLSRSFAKLRALGVETKGDQVAVPDIAILRKLSDGFEVVPQDCGPPPLYA
jgi:CRP-like cAMP-binding protein